MGIEKQLKSQLEKRKEKGNYKFLKVLEDGIDFYSNDYLGLARNKELKDIIAESYQNQSPIHNGSTGSRLLSGNTAFNENLESNLAEIYDAPAALTFHSGYFANLAVMSSIPGRNDTILYDKSIHACIKEGARLSNARYFSFRHNDVDHLIKKIRRAQGNIIVAIESVYSMDGDVSPLEDIADICEEFGACLIVDEAHSTGVYGQHGQGLVCELGLQSKVYVRVHTFGKALGVNGACAVGSQIVKDYLINYARQFIYTTASPMHTLVSISSAFKFLQKNNYLIRQLHDVIGYFKSSINKALKNCPDLFIVQSDSPIQAIVYPGNERVRALARHLQEHGFSIRPILSPTVKVGEERLRVCLHAFNTYEEIDQLSFVIGNFDYE